MPNWKSYESSVRLLSAIIAAHPGLKLNYDEIAAWFGSDASVGGIKFQFSTTIKKNLDALRDGRARGLDCKDITLPSLANYGQGGQEMAAIMGSDVTPNGLRFQFTDRIRPIGKKLQEMKSAGLDPKDIDLESLYSAKGGGKTGRNISKYFGKDSTKGGIEFQFRAIKQDAKRQKVCADAGGDPQTLGIGSGPVKGGGSAIAGQYGDGVTENGSAKKTPSKRTPAGGKRKAAAMKGEDGDDDEGMAETPSKKAKGARGAAKATPKRANKTAINYTESSDVDDEEGLTGRVKPEKFEESEDDIGAAGYGNGHASQYASNGHGNGHGYYNGNGNGHTMSHDNDGFEDDENFAGQDMYFEANEDEA